MTPPNLDIAAARELIRAATPGLDLPVGSRTIAAWRLSLKSAGFVGDLVLIEDLRSAVAVRPPLPGSGDSPTPTRRVTTESSGALGETSATPDTKPVATPSSAATSQSTTANSSGSACGGFAEEPSRQSSCEHSSQRQTLGALTVAPQSSPAVRLQTLVDSITSFLGSVGESIGLRTSPSAVVDAIPSDQEDSAALDALEKCRAALDDIAERGCSHIDPFPCAEREPHYLEHWCAPRIAKAAPERGTETGPSEVESLKSRLRLTEAALDDALNTIRSKP